MKAEAAE